MIFSFVCVITKYFSSAAVSYDMLTYLRCVFVLRTVEETRTNNIDNQLDATITVY